VHFDFGPGYHFLHVHYPHARAHFAKNEHYRKAKKLERSRDDHLQQAQAYLLSGAYDRAQQAFDEAIRAATRRQKQLAKLDRDRKHFQRAHADHRAHNHRRHRGAFWARWD
jgi:hypothetical protein